MTSDPTEMTNLNETERNNRLAQKGQNLLQAGMEVLNPERVEKWGEKTAAGAVGALIGFLGGCFVATNFSLPDEFKDMAVPISTSAGTGVAVLIVIQIDKRRKRIQDKEGVQQLNENIDLVNENIDLDFKRLEKYPQFGHILVPSVERNLQTRDSLLKGDSLGVVRVLPLSNDLPSNPPQNILPPATDTENSP
jgi:hypothetical protein